MFRRCSVCAATCRQRAPVPAPCLVGARHVCYCWALQPARAACTGHFTGVAERFAPMPDPVHGILSVLQVDPVLIDVGAAGAPPQVWDPIASRSIYIAFDPDSRDFRETTGGHFRRAVVVNKALSAD